MNVFKKFITNTRYKLTKPLDKDGKFMLGYKKHGELDLLYDGKVLKKDVTFASENFLDDKSGQKTMLFTKDIYGQIHIFNKCGNLITPNGIPFNPEKTDKPYGIKQADGKILVCGLYQKYMVLIDPVERKISQTFIEVEPLNKSNGERKVKYASGLSFYIDRDFKVVSRPFIDETEPDEFGNRIQTTYNNHGDYMKVLVNKKHATISGFYDTITKNRKNQFYEAYKQKTSSYHFLNAKGEEVLNTKTNSKFVFDKEFKSDESQK